MQYRLDIQLLRAFAVVVVVFYHLQISFFSKGFLGVDVFFVISGFLMAILYKEGQPAEFLKRRVRRLLPPYFFILLVTMLVGAFTLFPNELLQLNGQSIYALLFASNIGFWNEASYFSSAGFKPLLHLWTLGVEAQYYLFVPLIMWFFRKQSLSLLVLALGSFVLCTLMLNISPKTSFFMMPLRAWEFLIGAMAGLYFTNKGSVKDSSYNWIGMVGLIGLILIQVLPVDGERLGFISGHPGLSALLTCIATMLVITFGLPMKILASSMVKPFEYIGKISYSVYLVHFPVIVFYFYQPFKGTVLSSGNSMDAIIILIIISLLSLFCYYLIEKPGPKLNQGVLACVGVTAVFAFVVVSDTIVNKKFTSYELGFLTANQDRAPYRCGKIARIKDFSASTCLLNSGGAHERYVLLVGNSHADSIKTAFKDVADTYGYGTYFVVSNSPLQSKGLSAGEIVDEAMSKNIKLIVTHHNSGSVSQKNYIELLSVAAEKGISVVTIAPIPFYAKQIPEYIAGSYLGGRPVLALQTKEDHFLNVAADLKVLRNLRSVNPNVFTYYDPAAYLCDDSCKFMGEDGRAWYFDGDHLTLTGAMQLSPLFKDIFNDLAGSQ